MAQTRGGQRRDDTEERAEEKRERQDGMRENTFNNMYFLKCSLLKVKQDKM